MLGLLAAYGSDEESDSESGSDKEDSLTEQSASKLPKPFELPTPKLEGDVREDAPGKSVFINPYLAEDNKKTAALEQHVKMISTDVKTVNGKKICWNYRKNKCRFGHNCKYAHDSDLQTPVAVEKSENKFQQVPLPERHDIVSEDEVRRGKKRPGLSQTIVPGQKVMKKYYSQKSK